MTLSPPREQVDHRTLKLLVGAVALSLAWLTNRFAGKPLTSISASYWEGGWSQTIFIGFLFAIAAFMLAYTGYSRSEMVLSKVAALAGLGVALFPRGCDGRPDGVPKAHWISAAAMFLILAYFCYGFFHRARAKGHKEARRRAVIYALCGIAMPLSILVLAAGNRMRLGEEIPRLLRGCGGPDRIWCVVADRKSGAARPDARGRTLLALSRR